MHAIWKLKIMPLELTGAPVEKDWILAALRSDSIICV